MESVHLYPVLGVLCTFMIAWLISGQRKEARSPPLVEKVLEHLPLISRMREEGERTRLRRICIDQVPELLDIATLGLSAGLPFDTAISLYCVEYSNELSRELTRAMMGWRVGMYSRTEALERLAERLDLMSLRRFAAAVSESITFGSPLAGILERQAQTVREEQRALVEEEIEKAPVKMLIPLGTLIVPAMMLAILGPLLASTAGIG